MATMKAQRTGFVVLGIAAVGIAWASWAWSPALEIELPSENNAGEAAPAPISAAVTQQQPQQPAPVTAAPQVTKPATPEAAPVQEPERIPTPHPMSLDQTKPPEQVGPLSELKHEYASESRSADSSATEAKLRSLVSTPNIPAELIQGITCRRELCKIDMQWTPHRRIGFAVVLESFKQLYSRRVAVEPPAGRADDGTYPTTLYVRLNP